MDCRPAGMSSEEEEDEDWDDPPPPRNKVNNHQQKKSAVGSSSTCEDTKGAPLSLPLPVESTRRHSPQRSWHSNSGFTTRRWHKQRLPHGASVSLEELQVCVTRGQVKEVEAMIKQGILVDQVLSNGWSPLMFASSSGEHEMVDFLLKSGADPNFHKEQFTSLMAVCASSKDSEEDLLCCIDLLLDAGAIIDAVERHRMTAFMFAAKEGKVKIIQKLISRGTLLDKQDNKGYTALSWAAQKGHGHVVRTLIEAGADTSIINTSGQTAADLANCQGYSIIGQILEDIRTKKLQLTEDKSVLNGLVELGPKKSCIERSGYQYNNLEIILMGLELQHLIPKFKEHSISFEIFLQLTEDDLDTMNIRLVGERLKILTAIRDIHKTEWEKSSLPPVQFSKFISCPEAAALVASLARQVRYMHASVAYVRNQIQNQPRILELGQEAVPVQVLTTQMEEALTNVSLLFKELGYLKRHLMKIQDREEFLPADLILEQQPVRHLHRRFFRRLCVAGCIIWFCYWWKPEFFTQHWNKLSEKFGLQTAT